jgi:hypothetical protein
MNCLHCLPGLVAIYISVCVCVCVCVLYTHKAACCGGLTMNCLPGLVAISQARADRYCAFFSFVTSFLTVEPSCNLTRIQLFTIYGCICLRKYMYVCMYIWYIYIAPSCKLTRIYYKFHFT